MGILSLDNPRNSRLGSVAALTLLSACCILTAVVPK
jgi:hypothetical protein